MTFSACAGSKDGWTSRAIVCAAAIRASQTGSEPVDAQLLLGHHHDLPDQCLEGLLALAIGQQRIHPVLEIGRQGQRIGVRRRHPLNHERAEVRGQRRSAERTDPAERVAKHVDRGSTGLRRRVDDGGDILVLPCHVTVRSATVGAAARRSIA